MGHPEQELTLLTYLPFSSVVRISRIRTTIWRAARGRLLCHHRDLAIGARSSWHGGLVLRGAPQRCFGQVDWVPVVFHDRNGHDDCLSFHLNLRNHSGAPGGWTSALRVRVHASATRARVQASFGTYAD